MASTPLYLRPDTLVQPLVHQWYAWGHLVAPVPAALNVAGRHVKIMRSYLQSPQIHAAAAKNPELAGGPFVNLGGGRIEEISALLAETQTRAADLIALAGAVKELDDLLREARGFSLEPLYSRVPAPLKGYVELTYDRAHQPSFRLIEPLLYRSPHYRPELQSLALSRGRGDLRPFVLSTPILRDPEVLQIDRPFADPGLGELLRAVDVGRPLEHLAEALGLSGDDRGRLRELLTEEPPKPRGRYDGPGVRVRYFGHACLLFETASTSILVDPLVAYESEAQPPRFTLADLPDTIDYVLVTHHHKDHFLLETLLRLRHRVRTFVVPRASGGIVDPSMRLILAAVGAANVVELGELDELPLPDGCIRGVPFLGEHADLDVRAKLAYMIELAGRRHLVAADSSNLEPELYGHLRAAFGAVDTLFLGMECEGAPLSWLYGCFLASPLDRERDRSRRLSGSDDPRALALVERLGCKDVYVYAMGQEPWLRFLTAVDYPEDSVPIAASNRFIAALQRRSIVAERWYGKREILYLAGSDHHVAG